MELTQITETLYALPVPIDGKEIKAEDEFIVMFTDNMPELDGYLAIYIPFGLSKIIGTVTEEEIDFDCEPYVIKIHSQNGANFYRDYRRKLIAFRNSKASFRSLLSSKGINPTPETKLLIIEKV